MSNLTGTELDPTPSALKGKLKYIIATIVALIGLYFFGPDFKDIVGKTETPSIEVPAVDSTATDTTKI